MALEEMDAGSSQENSLQVTLEPLPASSPDGRGGKTF